MTVRLFQDFELIHFFKKKKAIQDDGIVRVEKVLIPRQLLLQALGQLQNSQNIEVRLKAYNTVIKQSKLLLVLTTKYENHFSVNPDEMTPNDLMIGNNI